MKKHQPIDETLALSIAEFCRIEKISKATYYKLKRLGIGPRERRLPRTRVTRITPEARREWRARMEQHDVEAAAAKEFERRAVQASHAGKLAAKSPLHISKRRVAR